MKKYDKHKLKKEIYYLTNYFRYTFFSIINCYCVIMKKMTLWLLLSA